MGVCSTAVVAAATLSAGNHRIIIISLIVTSWLNWRIFLQQIGGADTLWSDIQRISLLHHQVQLFQQGPTLCPDRCFHLPRSLKSRSRTTEISVLTLHRSNLAGIFWAKLFVNKNFKLVQLLNYYWWTDSPAIDGDAHHDFRQLPRIIIWILICVILSQRLPAVAVN